MIFTIPTNINDMKITFKNIKIKFEHDKSNFNNFKITPEIIGYHSPNSYKHDFLYFNFKTISQRNYSFNNLIQVKGTHERLSLFSVASVFIH